MKTTLTIREEALFHQLIKLVLKRPLLVQKAFLLL
jgi:hypothetical protein